MNEDNNWICDYWMKCKNGINDSECKVPACERRNDIFDEFRPKESDEDAVE